MNEISYKLIRAVGNGELEVVRDLVNRYGLSHCKLWADGYVLLRNSVEYKHTEITKLLLNSGAKVNSNRTEIMRSDTPIHLAVKNNDKEILQMLINRGSNINTEDSVGCTPLFLATLQGKEDIVEILLNSGANMCGNENGPSPLNLAVIKGLFNMAEKLLNHGSSVNSTCDLYPHCKGFTPLHFAAAHNKDKIAMLLLSHGANIDAGSQNMTTPLHIGTQEGNFTIVELLLKNGACVNAKSSEGLTPLHFASKNGNVKLMKLLLCNNAEVDSLAKNKMTPLCVAIKGLRKKAAKFLLDHGANVDAEDENGKTVLCFAVESGSAVIVENILRKFPDKNNASNKNSLRIAARFSEKKYKTIVEQLLKYGFSVETDDINDSSLLHNCVEMGYIKILKDLLKHGLDLSCNKDQNSLLHTAAKSKHIEVAKFLLTHGADVNAICKSGKPPIFYSTENSDVKMTKLLLLHGANIQKYPELLIIATKNVCKEMVEVLLQNEADIEATDTFGRTPLHLSALNNDKGYYDYFIQAKGEIAKLLLSKGANVNAKINYEGQTALHIACQRKLENLVETLLEYKADIDCTFKDCTPLHIAAQNGGREIVEMLLKNGANVNCRRENGETCLNIAAKQGHWGVLNTLFKYDADIESGDINGSTPLHSAAANYCCKTVSVLLQHGALINSQDTEGNTALHIASKCGKTEVVELLLKFGSDINILTNNNCTPMDLAMDFKNEVTKILKLHLIRLKTANLYINEKNSLFLHKHSDLENLYAEKYKQEIERLKNEKIGSQKVSLYDVLTKNISSLGKYAKNEDIRRIMGSNSYEVSFPIYASIIERNFRRGLQRCSLLDQVQEFFTLYLKLPYNCSDEILSYLSDGDLKNMIDV